jgi:aspartate/glutamate racemase
MTNQKMDLYEAQEILRTILQFDKVEQARMEREDPERAADLKEGLAALANECADYLAAEAPELFLELAPDVELASMDSAMLN